MIEAIEDFTEAVCGRESGKCETVGVRFKGNQTNERYGSKCEGEATDII